MKTDDDGFTIKIVCESCGSTDCRIVIEDNEIMIICNECDVEDTISE